MDLIWYRVCRQNNIKELVAKEWLERIQKSYSGENRYYHNLSMLNEKAQFLADQPSAVVFAVIFQYYNLDVHKSCSESNLNAFKEFWNASGLSVKESETNNVSITALYIQNQEYQLMFCSCNQHCQQNRGNLPYCCILGKIWLNIFKKPTDRKI